MTGELDNAQADSETLQVGASLVFGSYGGEQIEWRVLEACESEALLISEKCLDWKPMNWDYSRGKLWEDCDLKHWLETEFAENAFSEKERASVIEVACLDLWTARKRFSGCDDRIALPSAFALDQGAYASEANGACCWWLTPFPGQPDVPVFVYPDGDICMCAVCVDMPICAVRPSLRLALK